MQVRVGRIGKPHGIRGEVTVEVLTDAPEDRFVPGETFDVEPGGSTSERTLTVRSARWNKGILLLGFEEVDDRNDAERLRGSRLTLDSDEDDADDDDAWYEHELVDLDVVLAGDGSRIGRVVALQTMPAQDLLVIELADGREALVPFVEQIVPEVDIEGHRVVLDPPPGLLDVNSSEPDASESDSSQSDGSEPDSSPSDGSAPERSDTAGPA